jgi:hypothetical protein
MRLIIASLLALLLALNMAGCASRGKAQPVPADSNRANANSIGENPYTASFVSRDRPTVALQPDPAGPKIYRGNVETEDYQLMLENGYDMLGYSSFEAADVPPDQALEHARKIKADLVLVYTKLSGTVPASVRVEQLRNEAKKTAGQSADAQSSSVEQGPAVSGKLLPQEQARYSYFSSYWVKLAPPLIGVHVTPADEKNGATGLKVIAVIKQSPAAKAGIEDGDVLIRIGDVALDKPEALQQAAQRYAGQTVDVTMQHGGNTGKTAITLNSRN